ncbi:MAG: hypothetical protein EBU90_01675 [Proteobacteria bacterium]|nr:hypothetical protein [Pseudomonadota bacterium]
MITHKEIADYVLSKGRKLKTQFRSNSGLIEFNYDLYEHPTSESWGRNKVQFGLHLSTKSEQYYRDISFALIVIADEENTNWLKLMERIISINKKSIGETDVPNKKFMEMTIEQTAKMLYTEYCKEVGGFAWNGDKLPTWEEFVSGPDNPAKGSTLHAWRKVAEKALLRVENKHVEIIQIAKTCHSVNRAFQKFIGEETNPEWNEVSEELQNSAIEGVKKKIENPSFTPEQQHLSWCDYKIKHGWTYGETKDFEKKTHPCLVPYEELSENDKFKDKLFQAVITSFE